MSLKKQESVKLLKEDLSKILIKNRGGAENYLRGCGVNWSVSSDKILEDLVNYIRTGYYKKPKRKT